MLILFILIACGIIGAAIGSNKGIALVGFLLGFFLGIIGLIILIFIPGDKKQCPYCKEYIHKDATRCPKCQKDLM